VLSWIPKTLNPYWRTELLDSRATKKLTDGNVRAIITKWGNAPWIEGSWMTKHNGKYYLQYAGPGTEFKSYCDAVYVADKPLGPFKHWPNTTQSPIRPEGFIAGAGHSSTFQDKYGNYWHVSTMTISIKHMFERRLGLVPCTFFDKDGEPCMPIPVLAIFRSKCQQRKFQVLKNYFLELDVAFVQ
jgi:hypothetical protein